jgi:penicillin-binding protein 2
MPSTAWKMKNFHEKWYAGEVISVGIGQGAVAVTPLQLARAIGGIASGGALHRPHLVFPEEVPADELQAIHETFPGSGDKTVPLTTANWQLITDAMAETTTSGTAATAHLEGIDFAGKTGTAQVVSHSAGMTSLGAGKERANAWFVGMAPRRNPDIVVAVLWEHGGWGAGSAPVAAQVINAFVTKQRKRENNIRIAATPAVPATTETAASRAGATAAQTVSPASN